jgi:hypothetical protein
MMTTKRANEITGGLSEPEKMPMGSYNLPASACKTGSLMRKVAGSVCSRCYACKGRYVFSTARTAMGRRLASIVHPEWVEAMVLLIGNKAKRTPEAWRLFRWHDSGDLQSAEHLEKIIEVARRLPGVRFWLPTMETTIAAPYLADLPDNMVVRFSTPMLNGHPSPETVKLVRGASRASWTISGDSAPIGHHACPAMSGGAHTCRGNDCKTCWTTVPVTYKTH